MDAETEAGLLTEYVIRSVGHTNVASLATMSVEGIEWIVERVRKKYPHKTDMSTREVAEVIKRAAQRKVEALQNG